MSIPPGTVQMQSGIIPFTVSRTPNPVVPGYDLTHVGLMVSIFQWPLARQISTTGVTF